VCPDIYPGGISPVFGGAIPGKDTMRLVALAPLHRSSLDRKTENVENKMKSREESMVKHPEKNKRAATEKKIERKKKKEREKFRQNQSRWIRKGQHTQ
jgi:Ni/Co efflux regulator RcnB